jgi:serine/threonine protein kinase
MDEDRDLLNASLAIADGADTVPAAAAELSGPLQNIAHIAEFYRRAHQPLGVVAGGPRQWGPLELQEILGRGSYGIVYRALDPNLQREVALKILADDDPEPSAAHSDEILAEARRLAQLKHPNLVTVFGADRHDGQTGLWMELIDGVTLGELLAHQGTFEPREAARVGLDLCRALAAMHAAGLVHRDLKPANVMRERGGRIILMDLGTSAVTPTPAAGDTATSMQGTPLFTAPEVLRGAPAGVAADIYSLGALLDHLVSGSYPLQASTLAELAAKLEAGPRTPLRDRRPDLDRNFIAVVEQAMAVDPAARFASVGEFERALAAAGAPVGAAPTRRKRLPLVLAAVVVAAVALSWSWLHQPAVPTYQAHAALLLGTTDPPRLLNPGALVVPGDRLFLEFTGSQPLHVYVINEDDHGEAFVLFPLPGGTVANPVPAGTHRLPPARDGQPFSWGVSSAGGQEHFLIVASPEPVPVLEGLLASLPAARFAGEAAAALPIPAEAARRLRGVGVLLADPAAMTRQTSPGAISRVQDELRVGQTGRDQVWVQRIDLANPR